MTETRKSGKRLNALIIGLRDDGQKRNIGGELFTLLPSDRWCCSVLTTTKVRITDDSGTKEYDYSSSDPQEFRKALEMADADVVFIAMSTFDHGEAALRYVLDAIAFGAKVVTAEKGIISWQFHLIDEHLDAIDFGASVGGVTRMLYHPKLQYLRGRKVRLYVVLNGTCNFALWNIGQGGPLDSMLLQAQQRGIAEPTKPGVQLTFRNLLNGERPDTRAKAAGFYNKLLATSGQYLVPSDFGSDEIAQEDADRLLNPYDDRRLLVEITNERQYINNHNGIIAPMRAQKGEWNITIGFVPIEKGPIADWLRLVTDVNNGFLAYVDGDRFMDIGPGAGPSTAKAMKEGAYRLLGLTESF
jgi:hypothetical protein